MEYKSIVSFCLLLTFAHVGFAQQKKIDKRQLAKQPVTFRCPLDAAENPPRPKVDIKRGVITKHAEYLPQPEFPPQAKAIRISGSVAVLVVVDILSGEVIWASVVSGHPLLRGAVKQAVCDARFPPTLINSLPVNLSGTIVYNFNR